MNTQKTDYVHFSERNEFDYDQFHTHCSDYYEGINIMQHLLDQLELALWF